MTEVSGRDARAGSWPSRWPIWTLTALVVSVLVFFAVLYYQSQRTWAPLQRSYFWQYVGGSLRAGLGLKEGTYSIAFAVTRDTRNEPQLALDSGVVEVTDRSGQRKLEPSPAARDLGVLRIEWRKGRLLLERTQALLRKHIYGGSLWTLALRPGIAAGVIFLLGLYLAIPKDRANARERKHGRHLRGPRLVDAAHFNREVLARDGPGGIAFCTRPSWLRKAMIARGWAHRPAVWIPEKRLSSHFLLMGDTGAGKSSLLHQMLIQIEGRGEAAIVYDPLTEFTPVFYSSKRGDVILNPLDARMPYWSAADEVERGADTMAMAMSLFPAPDRPEEDLFFTEKPREIFAHLLDLRPRPDELVYWMSHPEEIDRRVAGTTHAISIDPTAPAQRAGVLASLNRAANAFKLLPVEAQASTRWSVGEWARERSGWLFLTSTPETRDRLLPLTSLWLDMLALRLLQATDGGRRVWFVLDELATLQKLPQLHRMVTQGRRSGNPVVLGFQGRSQLEKRYGIEAETLLSQPAVKVFLKTSEPYAAKWISDAIGEVEKERWPESRSQGSQRDSKSHASHIDRESLVMASQIGGLRPLRGYLKLDDLVTPLDIDRPPLREQAPGFVPRSSAPAPAPAARQAAPEPKKRDENPFFE